MGWDKFTGRCTKVGAQGSLYSVTVFEIMEGEVTATAPNGDMPELPVHVEIHEEKPDAPSTQATVAIITKLDDKTAQVEASKLYIQCPPEYAIMWRRVFTGFGGLNTPPKYDGNLTTFKMEGTGEEVFIAVEGRGALHLKPIASGNPSNTDTLQQLINPSLFYSEVTTLQDGSGSFWDDADFRFTNPVFASIGTFLWNAPAIRPNPSEGAWWLGTDEHGHDHNL